MIRRRVVRLRAGVFLLQGRPPARLPAKAAIRLRRVRITRASATRMSAIVARQIVEEHIDLCLDAGINLEGINAEVAKGQWEFQIFGKGSKTRRRSRCGWLAISCCASPKNTASISSGTASRSAIPTGTAPACTPISRPSICAKSAARSTSRSSWKRSSRTATSTSPFTVRTTTCA